MPNCVNHVTGIKRKVCVENDNRRLIRVDRSDLVELGAALGADSVLVPGAGGGCDLVTAQMVRAALLRDINDLSVDTASWLNPRFDHYYLDGTGRRVEQPIDLLCAETARFRRRCMDFDDLTNPGFGWYARHGVPKRLVDSSLRDFQQSSVGAVGFDA